MGLSDEQSDALARFLTGISAKGVVRRVRTPAGVARYKQPIGATIVPDVVPETIERISGLLDRVPFNTSYSDDMNYWIREENPPAKLYHVAPRAVRDDILKRGLDVSDMNTWNTGLGIGSGKYEDEHLWELGDDGEYFAYEYRPFGVYMFPTLERAREYASAGENDIYEIDTEENGREIIRDPSVAANWEYDDEWNRAYVTRYVKPGALKLVGSNKKSSKKSVDEYLDDLCTVLAELEGKGVQRHVRDVAFWGAPYGTPLPLPAGFKKPKELVKKRPKISPEKAKKAKFARLDVKDADPEVIAAARDITEMKWKGFSTTVNLRKSSLEKGVFWISGDVYKDGKKVGFYQRVLDYEDREMENAGLVLSPSVQGQGFAERFYKHVEEKAYEQGIRRVRIFANIDVGGYAWARRGFNFRDQAQRELFKDVVQMFADSEPGEVITLYGIEYTLTPSVIAQAQRLLRRWRSVTPLELSQLGERARSMRTTKNTRGGRKVPMWPGKSLMLGSGWRGVKPLTKPKGTKDAVEDYMDQIEKLIPYAETMFIPDDVFEPHKGNESDYNILGADLFYDPPLNFVADIETKDEYGTYEEKGVRRVRDAEYWGVPYGTIIAPGMKPVGQMRLPGMPKKPEVSETDSERLDRIRENDDRDDARRSARRMQDLIDKYNRWANLVEEDDAERANPARILYDDFGVDIESPYGDDLDYVVAGGDWAYFGACRDIREAAYDMLGFDRWDIEADPHLRGGIPEWGGGTTTAKKPDALAYHILEKIRDGDRLDIPAYRGVAAYGFDPETFAHDLKEGSTFDLPIASFTGNLQGAKRFGDGIVFKVEKGAKYVRGGFMGIPESVLEQMQEASGDAIYEEDYFDELEYTEIVTGGRFKVTHVKQDGATFIVTIRQIGVFDPDTGLAKKAINRRWKYAYLFDNSLQSMMVDAVVPRVESRDTRSNKPGKAKRGSDAR